MTKKPATPVLTERNSKMQNIVIRLFQPEDISSICKIAVQAWQYIHDCHRRHIGNDDLAARISYKWEEKKAGQIMETARLAPETVLIAEIEGKIVGFASYEMNKETGLGTVGNNAVAPEFQGMGIGAAMQRKILEIFRQNNLKYATVSTGYEDDGHAGARANYEKIGFKKTKTSVLYSLKL